VRRSGRQSKPKKDESFHYFSLKSPGTTVSNDDIEIDEDGAEDEEIQDDDVEEKSDKIAIIPEAADLRSVAVGQTADVKQETPKSSQVYTVAFVHNPPKDAGKSVDDLAAVTSDSIKNQADSEETDRDVGAVIVKQTDSSTLVTLTNNMTESSDLTAVNGSANGNLWNLKVPLTQSEEEKLRKRTCPECGIVLLSSSSMGGKVLLLVLHGLFCYKYSRICSNSRLPLTAICLIF
jgi:hypothetical protein